MRRPQQNEALIRDNNDWLSFSNPHQIVIAERLEDIVPSLQEIERRVEVEGWHAAGFISYEAAPAFDLALPYKPITGLPYLWFGLYPKPRPVELPGPSWPKEVLNWRPYVGRESYDSAIARIKEYIAKGQTYQVNYTMQLQADFDIDTWEFFLQIAQDQNQHAAYIDLGRYVICSASPELFFQLHGQTIRCQPMKGTVKRGRTTAEDVERSNWLKSSEKNRAENVMIVDMIRNDLGRIAKMGSVQVPELFQTQRYPTLWQMTSTVTAFTPASITDIFKALFPCASITGAPKVSTMKIIAELEHTPRKIYTGSIGYIFPEKKAKFNVAIRTALINTETQKAEYGIGGGIVWDSTTSDEYAEALLKARLLTESGPSEFALLETLLWTPEEGYFLLEKHLQRLMDSAHYFDFAISRNLVENHLFQLKEQFVNAQRVRLLVDRKGNMRSEHIPYQKMDQTLKATLADRPVNSTNVFLFHKTTERSVYEKARQSHPDVDDVLLYNEDGDLTEFTIGNLVVERNGQLLTPPIACGVLAGTFRAHLVETGTVRERAVPVRQLKACTRIFRVNSVRQWERVDVSISRGDIIAR